MQYKLVLVCRAWCFAICLCSSLFRTQTMSAQVVEAVPKGFGKDDQNNLLPGFGSDQIKIPYQADDLQRAQELIGRYDTNRDGLLDKKELQNGTWRYGQPLEFDFNRDGKISKVEMAQRLTSRAVPSDNAPPVPRYSVLQQMRQSTATPPKVEDETPRRFFRGEGGNRRSRELTFDIMIRFDRNQDRRLDTFERKDLGIDVIRIDADGDDLVDGLELYEWIDSQIEERVGDLTDILPDWFFEKDENKDRQVEMSEFADTWSDDLLLQFHSMDSNQDGVITAVELTESKSVVGGSYTSTAASLITPRSQTTSTIEIQDDLVIEKLRIQLSITHDYTEQIAAYLLTPKGIRIDLFRGAGGSGDHFEGTLFDDKASERIQRAASPFRGSYQPIAMEQNQPSLKSLTDTPLKGTWQLVIDADRNQRFGILHSWSILVVPRKQKELPPANNSDSINVEK